MPKGIAWDDLPSPHERYSMKRSEEMKLKRENDTQSQIVVQNTNESIIQPETPEDIRKRQISNAKTIAKRVLFGFVSGSLTGLFIETVNVLKDNKLMLKQSKEISRKVLRTAASFGGFFSAYHGLKSGIHIYDRTLPAPTIVIYASFISIAPLLAVPTLRPVIPYASVLVLIDCVQEFMNARES